MKKSLLTFAICALTLSSCTSVAIDDEGALSNTITFTNVVNKPSRAMDGATFNQFFINGYYTRGNDLNTRFNIFTDTQVSQIGGVWSSAISRFWVSGATYSFYAYSCENSKIDAKYGGPSVGMTDGIFRINYTCHSTGGSSHDLIFASATGIVGKESNNLPVPLAFKHILSKVSLQFVSDFPDGYKVEISDISISNFENMGTFVADQNKNSDGIWDPQSIKYDDNNPKSFSLTTIGSNITGSGLDPVLTSACYMIPNNYNSGAGGDNPVIISFKIRLFNENLSSGNQTIVSNTLYGSWHPKWRMGTQYVYTIHLAGNEAGLDKIDFNVGLANWNDPEADNNPEQINISLDYQIATASEE